MISDAAGNPLDFSQGRFFPWLNGGIVAATPRQAGVLHSEHAVTRGACCHQRCAPHPLVLLVLLTTLPLPCPCSMHAAIMEALRTIRAREQEQQQAA